MRIEEERFVERMGGILAAEGLPPVAGRLWAWLLVCDPPEQTAEDQQIIQIVKLRRMSSLALIQRKTKTAMVKQALTVYEAGSNNR